MQGRGAEELVDMTDRTPVTAILLCCNNEPFVAEAVRSALAQDYAGPLEIIVSDDASGDRTFDIVQEAVKDYGGPHSIRMLQQKLNTGSKSAHLNQVVRLAAGEVIVSFDGDDVSEPFRVGRIMEAFRRDPKVQAVYSSYALIDESGRPIGPGKVPHPSAGMNATEWFARVDAYAAGTTLALRRTVFESFDELDPDIHEDIVLPFRACLLGAVTYIDENLVMARRHQGSLTANFEKYDSLENYRTRMLRGIERARLHHESRQKDLDAACDMMPERAPEFANLREIVSSSLSDAESTAGLVSSSLLTRTRTLFRLAWKGLYREEFAQNACLTFFPKWYLRYKRRRLGTVSEHSVNMS